MALPRCSRCRGKGGAVPVTTKKLCIACATYLHADSTTRDKYNRSCDGELAAIKLGLHLHFAKHLKVTK